MKNIIALDQLITKALIWLLEEVEKRLRDFL
jgi:hypothetical protein